MNKIIIPRKDHEVYFLPLPKEIKAKLMRVFVTEQMERLHPCFSSTSALDLRQFIFNQNRWIMVTVMKAETLAEYKIPNKGAVLYTNTSIAAHKKDFIQNGVNTIDDERIGFDAERNEPVSVPLEPGKADGSRGLTTDLALLPV